MNIKVFYLSQKEHLNFSKHGLSELDSTNVSFQLLSDVPQAERLLIPRLSPTNSSARLLSPKNLNEKIIREFSLDLCDVRPEQVRGFRSSFLEFLFSV